MWESKKYYIFQVCVCSFSYPACNMHVPFYIVIWGLSGCVIFFYIILYGMTFRGGGGGIFFKFCCFFFFFFFFGGVGWGGGGGKLFNMCVLIISATFV